MYMLNGSITEVSRCGRNVTKKMWRTFDFSRLAEGYVLQQDVYFPIGGNVTDGQTSHPAKRATKFHLIYFNTTLQPPQQYSHYQNC